MHLRNVKVSQVKLSCNFVELLKLLFVSSGNYQDYEKNHNSTALQSTSEHGEDHSLESREITNAKKWVV